jgi:hypothetical protein
VDERDDTISRRAADEPVSMEVRGIVSELARGHGVRLVEAGEAEIDDSAGLDFGRHTYDEDAELTPIFHALARGGWRSRQPERPLTVVPSDPMQAFEQDPLGAPIPSQAMRRPARTEAPPTEAPRRRSGGAHALPEARSGGRHHRRFVSAGG